MHALLVVHLPFFLWSHRVNLAVVGVRRSTYNQYQDQGLQILSVEHEVHSAGLEGLGIISGSAMDQYATPFHPVVTRDVSGLCGHAVVFEHP